MTDETKKTEETNAPESGEKSDRPMGPGDVVDEVTRLGHKLGAVVHDVWESEQRKQIQTKVIDELRSAGGQARNLAHDVRSGRLGTKEIQTLVVDELRQAKAQVETLAKEVTRRKSEPAASEGGEAAPEAGARVEVIGRKISEGILSGLRALNRELGKALEPDESHKEPPKE